MRVERIPGLLSRHGRFIWSRRFNLLKVAVALPMLWNFCTSAAVSAQENPYRHIYERNLFGLRTPVVQTAQPPAVLPSNVILTGITTVLGAKRAFLEITVPAKPPLPTKQQSCILSEGQREANVEVLEIDAKAETVKVSNSGTVMTLTFEKNGRKPTQAPTPPTIAGRSFPLRPPTLRSPGR
jgi:hypothetical protein